MADFIFKEDGFYLLQETGDRLLLEQQLGGGRTLANGRSNAGSRSYAGSRTLVSSRTFV